MNHHKQLPSEEPASALRHRRGGTLMRLALCVGMAMVALGLAAQLLG